MATSPLIKQKIVSPLLPFMKNNFKITLCICIAHFSSYAVQWHLPNNCQRQTVNGQCSSTVFHVNDKLLYKLNFPALSDFTWEQQLRPSLFTALSNTYSFGRRAILWFLLTYCCFSVTFAGCYLSPGSLNTEGHQGSGHGYLFFFFFFS